MMHIFYTRPGEPEPFLGLYDVRGDVDVKRLRLSLPADLTVDSAFIAEGHYSDDRKWISGKRIHTFFEGGSLGSAKVSEFIA